jgi:hypothetical protein
VDRVLGETVEKDKVPKIDDEFVPMKITAKENQLNHRLSHFLLHLHQHTETCV